jgi:hypothetical protein
MRNYDSRAQEMLRERELLDDLGVVGVSHSEGYLRHAEEHLALEQVHAGICSKTRDLDGV